MLGWLSNNEWEHCCHHSSLASQGANSATHALCSSLYLENLCSGILFFNLNFKNALNRVWKDNMLMSVKDSIPLMYPSLKIRWQQLWGHGEQLLTCHNYALLILCHSFCNTQGYTLVYLLYHPIFSQHLEKLARSSKNILSNVKFSDETLWYQGFLFLWDLEVLGSWVQYIWHHLPLSWPWLQAPLYALTNSTGPSREATWRPLSCSLVSRYCHGKINHS